MHCCHTFFNSVLRIDDHAARKRAEDTTEGSRYTAKDNSPKLKLPLLVFFFFFFLCIHNKNENWNTV